MFSFSVSGDCNVTFPGIEIMVVRFQLVVILLFSRCL